MNFIFRITLLSFLIFNCLLSQELIIQEEETGFCFVDGIIQTDTEGYTGNGYANPDAGIGVSMAWNIMAESADTCYLRWRYALGGSIGDRPAKLLINGMVAIDTVEFFHTGTWTNWTITDSIGVYLAQGSNNIRIEAYSVSGLANYDYISIIGSGIVASECNNFYTLNIDKNIDEAGVVTINPDQDYYEEGTLITIEAGPNSGYFFQSWSGDITSEELTHSFLINKNSEITAIFLPEGTSMDTSLIGYATVQDNEGTEYMLIGGKMGSTVEANSLEDLNTYLTSNDPYIVTLSKQINGAENITVSSNKTFLGITDSAYLKGIGLEISDARNVIVKNLKISHVTPQDAVEINNSKNVWIDHCDLFSDQDHGTEYYDGLLDIKNASSFITVSWSRFHDHYKTILISSGDTQVADTTTRITFHHNYFHNCESRLPSIRFGKAHIFNNYYKDCGTAINSRMGACVRVEKNYFENVGTAVMMSYSVEGGYVELIDNYFGTSSYATSPVCILLIPYEYEQYLNETLELPELLGGDATSISENGSQPADYKILNYPNPFNPETVIRYSLPVHGHVNISIYSVLGQQVATLVSEYKQAGNYTVTWDASQNSSGIYFYHFKSNNKVITRKMVLIK